MIGWRWKFGFLQFSLISQEKSLNINKLIGALFSVLQQRSEYSMLIKNTRIIQKLQRRQLGLTMTILKFFLIYLFKSTSRVVYIISYSSLEAEASPWILMQVSSFSICYDDKRNSNLNSLSNCKMMANVFKLLHIWKIAPLSLKKANFSLWYVVHRLKREDQEESKWNLMFCCLFDENLVG